MNIGEKEFTSDQIEEFQQAFDMFDDNGDGLMSMEELNCLLISLGQRLSEIQLQKLMKQVDTNNSGYIEFPEFLKLMKTFTDTANSDSEIRKSFDLFDEDKDGFLSAKDLQYAMLCMGEKITDAEARMMVTEASVDNERVSFNEFYSLMTTQ